ncbi:MAG: AI-2E family transporter [Fimbriimonas sp.]
MIDGFVQRYRAVAFGGIALLVLALAVALFIPFLPAVLWATTFSILMYPLYQRKVESFQSNTFLKEKGIVEGAASLYATLTTLFLIFIPILIIGGTLYFQVHRMVDQIDESKPTKTTFSIESALSSMDVSLKPIYGQVGAADFSAKDWFEKNREEVVQNLRAPVARGVGQILYTIVTLVIALLTMFFLVRDAEKMREPFERLIPLPPAKTFEIISRVAETVRAVFVGTVLVAIIQGTIIGIAYFLAGVPNSFILGIFSILLCIIPLLGAPVLYIPVGLFLLIQGNVQGAAIVLATGFAIVSQIDNVLKPYFIAGRANLHPMAIFFAILGGVLLIGPIGVMAGPMILTVALAILEILREHIRLHEENELVPAQESV